MTVHLYSSNSFQLGSVHLPRLAVLKILCLHACKYKDIGVHEHLTGTFPTLSLPSCSHPQHSKQLELRDCLALLT
jgi:hypothetical protein